MTAQRETIADLVEADATLLRDASYRDVAAWRVDHGVTSPQAALIAPTGELAAKSTDCRNTSSRGVHAMGITKQRRATWAMRGKLHRLATRSARPLLAPCPSGRAHDGGADWKSRRALVSSHCNGVSGGSL